SGSSVPARGSGSWTSAATAPGMAVGWTAASSSARPGIGLWPRRGERPIVRARASGRRALTDDDQHLAAQKTPGRGNAQIQGNQPRGCGEPALRGERKEPPDRLDRLEIRRLQALEHPEVGENQPVVEEVEIVPPAIGEVRLEHDERAPRAQDP